MASRGPSPRERGSPAAHPRRQAGRGSIPARAGQPWVMCLARPAPRVHPRASGAAIGVKQFVGLLQGPSPRERGSRWPQAGRALALGSIPARAGQPRSRLRQADAGGVHPRASGAAPIQRTLGTAQEGPSPRERGSPPIGQREAGRGGSIPARAGQPAQPTDAVVVVGVHPRASGAAAASSSSSRSVSGPSPRERGSRAWVWSKIPAQRSIPARAGQPGITSPPSAWWGGHPRASGAADAGRNMASSDEGPSPRERGSRQCHTF